MKVIVEQHEELEEDKVVIYCREESEKIKRIKGAITSINMKICGALEDKRIMVSPDEVYYIESIDKRTFVYLKNKVLEYPLRLILYVSFFTLLI